MTSLSSAGEKPESICVLGAFAVAGLPEAEPRKFQKKRVGAKAAKRAEVLDQIHEGEELVGENATAFRALAARANYLALDRPRDLFRGEGALPRVRCASLSTPGPT